MGNWKIIIPEATVNLITNPQFEKNTTGWAADGTNTIAQSTAESFRGNYSLKCTYQNDLDLARFTITLTAAAHAFGCWVYIPSDWDGGAIQLSIENFTSVTIDTATTTETTTGEWVYIEVLFTPDSGDLTGDLVIEAASAPTAGKYIYIDAAQCEAKAYSTTYCDGDQDGCEWDGEYYASTSSRPVTSRAGGRKRDLADDYNFPVEEMIGVGMPDLENVMTERVFTPGADYQRLRVPERQLTLISTVAGSSMSNYHSKRQALIKALAPDTHLEEPVILRYEGATIVKEIKVRYAGGLTMTGPDGFTEHVGLQFIAAEHPLFEGMAENSAPLTTKQSVTFNSLAARINGVWSDLDSDHTYTSYINAMRVDPLSGKLYIGGSFQNWDNIANADAMAYWDGSQWNAMGTGTLDGYVTSIRVLPNGDVLVGGSFDTMGGVTCYGVALWDGTSWNALGPPSDPGASWWVADIEYDPKTDRVYIGGNFTNWNGNANADGIAYWNGTTWNPMGTGVGGTYTIVRSLLLDKAGNLWVAGPFATVNGQTCEGLAMWTDDTWYYISTDLQTGAGYPDINTLAMDEYGILYCGGDYTVIGGVSATNLASYNGATFTEVGPPDDYTATLSFWKGHLVVGGPFGIAGPLDVDQVALWNGSSWAYIDLDCTNFQVHTVYGHGDGLYIETAGDVTTTSGAVTTVTPGGTARVYPKVIIKRSGGTSAFIQNLGNETTEKYIWLDYLLADGETVILDFNPDRPSAVSSYYGPITPMLPHSNLSDFYLLPNTANSISCYIKEAGSPTVTAFIVWKDQYWSID